MKKFLDKKTFIILLFVYIFFMINIFSYFNKNRDNALDQYNQSSLEHFTKEYSVVHKEISNEIFLKFINVFQKPDIIDIMLKANQTSDENVLNRLRLKLIDIIRDDVNDINSYGIKLIHFHLPKAISFLRMHNVNHFGDDISKIRPSIMKVNETKSLVTGYEIGRHAGAFRNIIPLFSGNKFVGSMEISFNEYKLIGELEKNMKSEFDFIIEKDFVDKRVFKSSKLFYSESNTFSNYYYISKVHEKLITSSLLSFEDIEAHLISQELDAKLKSKKPFFIAIPLDKQVVSMFIPLKDFNNNIIGYFISYSVDTEEFRSIYKNYYIDLIFSIVILTGFIIFIFIILMHNKENKLRKKYFDIVFNTQKDIIVITDGKYISDANQAFFNFFKYKNIEDFRKVYNCICEKFEIIDKEGYIYKDKNGQSWIKTVEENKDINYKAVITKDENSYIFNVNSVSMEFDESKRNIVVLSDISELIDIQNNLQEKVEESVDAIRKQEIIMFRQSKQASLGEMISMIAHQWRQPLSSISATVGFLQIEQALNEYDKDLFTKHFKKISKYTQHLSQTIDDFRNFFKDDKETKAVIINDIVESTLEIVEPVLINKNIFIHKEYKSKKEVLTYPNELKQVFLNIFKNAEDAFLEKGIKDAMITVKTYDYEDYVSVMFEDNAGGIPDEVGDRIFDPYFTTKEELNGTGLGLYMSKDIIVKHLKGNIFFENIEDTQGTTIGVCFTINIPLTLDKK